MTASQWERGLWNRVTSSFVLSTWTFASTVCTVSSPVWISLNCLLGKSCSESNWASRTGVCCQKKPLVFIVICRCWIAQWNSAKFWLFLSNVLLQAELHRDNLTLWNEFRMHNPVNVEKPAGILLILSVQVWGPWQMCKNKWSGWYLRGSLNKIAVELEPIQKCTHLNKLNFLGFLSKAAELFDHILSPPGSFYTNLSVERVCVVKERISSVDDWAEHKLLQHIRPNDNCYGHKVYVNPSAMTTALRICFLIWWVPCVLRVVV